MKRSELRDSTFIEWDGRTTAGEACSSGVYFYVLRYTDAKGDNQKRTVYYFNKVNSWYI
ncbi:MAG: hypothetical protein V4506_00540 [Bacteroidota bacterium]